MAKKHERRIRVIGLRLVKFFRSNRGKKFTINEIFEQLNLRDPQVKLACVDSINKLLDGMVIFSTPEKELYFNEYYTINSTKNVFLPQQSKKRKPQPLPQKKAEKKPFVQDDDAVMHDILEQFNLPCEYPEIIEKCADQISADITDEEIAAREDFRKVLTFTIDPRDAKDFDDALSIRKLDRATWEVGVHIADVSYYVKEGRPIDDEAQRRATSVYLVDRTIPMLPERLCNYICSLRPDEDKLAFSVIFEIDEKGNIFNSRIVHTVIRSNRRFTYEEVQEVLELNGEALDVEGAKPVAKSRRKGECCNELITLNRIAHKLREERLRNGAIDFDSEEMRFDVDENGHPINVYIKKEKDANKLVEEFMLLANRTVAESIGKPGNKRRKAPKTLPYRIHDLPDPTKLENLSHYLSGFNIRLQTQGNGVQVAKSMNKMLHDVSGKKFEKLVNQAALRAMQKARYSVFNIGHYGLAFDYYTHFTSPIRRYPDLMVHRLITRYAVGGTSVSKKEYEALCEHCSVMEQQATAAERASVKYKMVEFMRDRIGQEYDATIVGITEFGIYSSINENHCEGFTHIHYLGDESFSYDERNYCLVGNTTRQTFALGDMIRIRVAKADLEFKKLSFDFISRIQ